MVDTSHSDQELKLARCLAHDELGVCRMSLLATGTCWEQHCTDEHHGTCPRLGAPSALQLLHAAQQEHQHQPNIIGCGLMKRHLDCHQLPFPEAPVHPSKGASAQQNSH